MNTPEKYVLNNSKNYESALPNIIEIVKKYNSIILQYLYFIIEIMDNPKITNFNSFIIMRGFNTITHVFTMILYYSLNVDLAYYHGEKSFYYYVEFINQITDDQHMFLQLKSKDATMFVYKKTIFEINDEMRKKNRIIPAKSILKLDLLKLNVNIMQKLLNNNIKKIDKKLIDKIKTFCDKISNGKISIENFEKIFNNIAEDKEIEEYIIL